MGSDQSQARRFYLITSPRTGSNLLLKILALEDQPNVEFRKDGGYFFLRSVMLQTQLGCSWTHVEQLSADQRGQIDQSIKSCFDEFSQHIENAEAEGKMVVVKEHASFLTNLEAKSKLLFGEKSVVHETPLMLGGQDELIRATGQSIYNQTVLSDEFLKTWLPIFLIRHPALAFPSFYRVWAKISDEEFLKSVPGRHSFQMTMTMHWIQNLYSFYAEHFKSCNGQADEGASGATWPIVLDADDIMTEPAVLVKLCSIIGLDSERLRYEWDIPAEEAQNDRIKAFRATIDTSTKIITAKTAHNIDIEEEGKKWREEFGQVDGQMVEKYVREAMPSYEFLKSKRLRA